MFPSHDPGRSVGVSYADSIWLKTNDGSTVTLLFRDDIGSRFNQLINITPTWTRFSLAGVSASTTNQTCKIWIRSGVGTSTFADISAWGGQSETGSFSTSDIITDSTSVTRNADIAIVNGLNFSEWWQSVTGGVSVRVIPNSVTGIKPCVQFDDGTSDNIISLRGNVTNPELYIKNTTDQSQIDAGTITANTSYTLAAAWNTNDCAASVNGGVTITDNSASIPNVSQLRVGSDGTDYLNGHIVNFKYWGRS